VSRFIIRRIVRAFVALLLFQASLFGLIHSLPYDFSVFVSFGGSPNNRVFVQSYYGLDLPFLEQLFNWWVNFFKFDLGESFLHWPTPVSEILLTRMPRTLLLFLSATILAYVLGFWLGKTIAWRRGTLLEFGLTLGGVAGYTSFAPWLGFVAINIFGWYLGWLPYQRLVNPNIWFNAPITIDYLLVRMVISAIVILTGLYLLNTFTRKMKERPRRLVLRIGGYFFIAITLLVWWQRSGISRYALDVLDHLALPLGTVVLLSFGESMMLIRMSMLETMREDYVLTARAKGLSENVIRDRHVARNAILPVITRMLLNLPFVLVGSLAIELVFMWHGMGKTLFDAIEFQDIPMLMGILSVTGIILLCAHVLLDILYVYLDPRLRFRSETT